MSQKAKQRRFKKESMIYGIPVKNNQSRSYHQNMQNEENNVVPQQKKPSSRGTFDKFVIAPEQNGRRVFTFFIIILSLFSTFSAAYFACFGFPSDSRFFFISFYAMEGMFAIDIILCFFTQYVDDEDNKPIRDLKKIALKYLKTGFPLDALATVPFPLILQSKFDEGTEEDIEKLNLLFLLKLVRFRKMMSLFETKNF